MNGGPRSAAGSLLLVMYGLLLCRLASAEHWPGYEGTLHQSSSATDVAPPLALKWQRHLTELVRAHRSDTWSLEGQMQSRNLAVLAGSTTYVALCATVHAGGTENRAYVTVLDASDGSVVNCVEVASSRYGAYKNMYDATDIAFGEQVVAWDPDTGYLFLSAGGDMPGHAAIDPLANAGSYSGTSAQNAVGAYVSIAANHPGLEGSNNRTRTAGDAGSVRDDGPLATDEWAGGWNRTCNRCAFFDLQPGSPYIVMNRSLGHDSALGTTVCHKYTGLNAKKPYMPDLNDFDNVTSEAGLPVFHYWGGVLVDGNDLYCMGPYEGGKTAVELATSSKGLWLARVPLTPTDLQANDGYTGPGAAETGVPGTKAFDVRLESTGGADESWHTCGAYNEGYQRNKAWLVEGGGAWAAWKPSTASTVQLVRAAPAVELTYDLGVGAGMRGQDIWPNIAYADCGADGEYIVYYLANAYTGSEGQELTPAGPATLTVFRIDDSPPGVTWTFELNAADGSGPYASLPPSQNRHWYEMSRMVVAGDHAYVAWVDATGATTNCALNVAAFDITSLGAPGAPPAPFQHDLGVPAAGNDKSRVIDLAATDGTLYALITESADAARVTMTTGQINAQRVVALEATGGGPSTYTLSGTVTLTGGDLASTDGVRLRVLDGATQVDAATLTAAGTFSFIVAAGTYDLELSAAGYTFVVNAGGSAAVSGDVTGHALDATATAVPTYSVSGTVMLAGDLADTAGVTLRISLGVTQIDVITLDASGTFSFTGLANGTYTLTALSDGYTITIAAGGSVTVAGADVSGYAVSGDAAAVVPSTAPVSSGLSCGALGAPEAAYLLALAAMALYRNRRRPT